MGHLLKKAGKIRTWPPFDEQPIRGILSQKKKFPRSLPGKKIPHFFKARGRRCLISSPGKTFFSLHLFLIHHQLQLFAPAAEGEKNFKEFLISWPEYFQLETQSYFFPFSLFLLSPSFLTEDVGPTIPTLFNNFFLSYFFSCRLFSPKHEVRGGQSKTNQKKEFLQQFFC